MKIKKRLGIFSLVATMLMALCMIVAKPNVAHGADPYFAPLTGDELLAYFQAGPLAKPANIPDAQFKVLDQMTITEDIVLDLGGLTLTIMSDPIVINGGHVTVKNGSIYAAGDAFWVDPTNGDASLTIESDVTIDAWYNCVYIRKPGAVLNTSGTLISSGGEYAAIQGNGSDGNGGIEVNITGGSITSACEGVYFPNTTELNISGGTITGTTAVYHKSGVLNITGGTLVGTGDKNDYVHNANGCNSTGDALVIEACDYPGGVPVVSITGGTFTSDNAAIGYYKQSNSYKLANEKFITGGIFSSNVSEYVAIGYEFVDGVVRREFDGTEVIPVTPEIIGGVLVDRIATANEASICFELLNVPNDATVLVKLFADDVEIGTQTKAFVSGGTITCNFYTVGTSSSWTQTPAQWEAYLCQMPTHAELYIDDVKIDECAINFDADAWKMHPGVELMHRTTIKNIKLAFTCADVGYSGDVVCTICDTTVEYGHEVINPCYSDDIKLVGFKPKKCTEDGYTGDKVCQKCGKTSEYGEPIISTGHDRENAVLRGFDEANCQKGNGYSGDLICPNCNGTIETGHVVVGEHNFVDGVCTVCGKSEIEDDNATETPGDDTTTESPDGETTGGNEDDDDTTTDLPNDNTTTEAPDDNDDTTTGENNDDATTESPEDETTAGDDGSTENDGPTTGEEDDKTTGAVEDDSTTEAPEDDTTEAPGDDNTTEAPEDEETTGNVETGLTVEEPKGDAITDVADGSGDDKNMKMIIVAVVMLMIVAMVAGAFFIVKKRQ